MNGEGVEKKLYDAASRGDLATFQQLLQGDPYLLDGVSFAGSRNLLHIATIWGQPAIVEEVLKIHQQLARNLDSQKSSPLHMAAAQGHTQIATKLSSVPPEMCWWRDCHGMNPVHLAGMNGHVEILEVLIRLDRFPAMEKVDGGQTVLHLCVKHRRFSELEFLVGKLGDVVHSKNDDGETILHLSTKYEEVEMMKWLAENTNLDKQAKESSESRAVEIIEHSSRDSSSLSEIIELLRGRNQNDDRAMKPLEFLDKMVESTMVAAVLIAAMAFQATMSPPGGVWQEDSSTHKAGEAVMVTTHPTAYKRFINSNSSAFLCSFMTIIQLITRRSIRNPLLLKSILVTVIMLMIFVAISYIDSIKVITPNKHKSVATLAQIGAGVGPFMHTAFFT